MNYLLIKYTFFVFSQNYHWITRLNPSVLQKEDFSQEVQTLFIGDVEKSLPK